MTDENGDGKQQLKQAGRVCGGGGGGGGAYDKIILLCLKVNERKTGTR